MVTAVLRNSVPKLEGGKCKLSFFPSFFPSFWARLASFAFPASKSLGFRSLATVFPDWRSSGWLLVLSEFLPNTSPFPSNHLFWRFFAGFLPIIVCKQTELFACLGGVKYLGNYSTNMKQPRFGPEVLALSLLLATLNCEFLDKSFLALCVICHLGTWQFKPIFTRTTRWHCLLWDCVLTLSKNWQQRMETKLFPIPHFIWKILYLPSTSALFTVLCGCGEHWL